ncbi:hypothetical protein AVEN_176402-1 [Araneus ventricosus]|uniref:Uncharacterized protein n=1 Tax=Araneus ventricosus TaxID=182803 RepID=A0A4Y2C7K0_ARAVE|nr:hypothetical protein AVEN_176402-1 [Araneus ventricosus]
MFIEVLIAMLQLFYFCYILAFVPKTDNLAYASFILGVMQYFTVLLLLILPAAAVNEVAKQAVEIIASLPTLFPEYYKDLKKKIRQKCMKEVSLSLWKIYRIDTSLLVTALGTLISYGVLFGTFGTIQNIAGNNQAQDII